MPYTGDLNNNLFLIILEAGKSKIPGPAGSVTGEGQFCGSYTALSCCVLTWGEGIASSLESLL